MNHKETQKTVLLGLSGGVDSSVAALLLKKSGYKVIGAFMKNFSDTKNVLTGECNWIEERKMAQKIASKLEIPFVTLDFEKEYKKYVIDPMFRSYEKGLTPNPDVACNTIIKFPLLWKKAKSLKYDYIATGHYARIKKTKQGFQLLQGIDKTKDQSYFLYELSQKDLEHALLPLGNFTKDRIRKIAKENHFPNWDKQGSRGICFVGKVNMKSFLSQKIKEKQGKVLDPQGNEIGTHRGSHYYTIGQRIGPHIGFEIIKQGEQKRWYVAQKKGNTVIAAPENHPLLKRKEVKIKKLKIINTKEKLPSELNARFRHLGKLHKGKLIKKGQSYSFIFNKPQEQIAAGQALVLYKGNQLVAGGQIS